MTASQIEPHFHRTALVAASVLVAQADGWITQGERERFLGCLQQMGIFEGKRRLEALHAFDCLADQFEQGLAVADRRAESAIRRLTGDRLAAQTLIRAAMSVASADSDFDREERTVLIRLCLLLDLSPQAFGLVVD